MNFSASSLAAGFIFGVIGVFLLKRGKQDGHVPWFAIGLALMIYPYFVENLYLLWGCGLGLLGLARVLR